MTSVDEINARKRLDDAIRAYSQVFDEMPATLNAWVLVYERSSIFPETAEEPLRYAQTYTSSIGTSASTALGLLGIATRLVERMAASGLEGEDES